MFCKFKHWSQRLLERGGGGEGESDVNHSEEVVTNDERLRKQPLRRTDRPRSMFNHSSATSSSIFSPNTTTTRTTRTRTRTRTTTTTTRASITAIPLQPEIHNHEEEIGRGGGGGGEVGVSGRRNSDPRELPRPSKYGLIRSSKNVSSGRRSLLEYCYMNPACQESNAIDQEEQYSASSSSSRAGVCRCINCTVLPTITECGVCLEPLQGQKVHSCPICANLTCKHCASRLENCPFCRTTIPALPNVALERLLDRLALPCKNSRSGCTELVLGDGRKDHQTVCVHSTFSCPVGSHICGWHGDLIRIEDHLKTAHDLRPIIDNGIAVEISGFRGKAYAIDGRQYTVCLSCHHHLYVVKIVLFQGKLRLSFSQLGSASSSKLSSNSGNKKITTDPSRTYGVWVEVWSNIKVLKGALPFGNKNCDTREIEITCDNIVPKDDKDNHSDNSNSGSVKINIVIKPITVV